ncbi:MAG: helix-turn-helix domain-containing protein [Acidimicrobiales bacterium]
MRKSIHSPEQERLIGLLRRMRKDAGLRQKDLSARLGRPQSFVSKYETGERQLDFVEVAYICHVLGRNLVSFVEEYEAGG